MYPRDPVIRTADKEVAATVVASIVLPVEGQLSDIPCGRRGALAYLRAFRNDLSIARNDTR